jgi:alpha-L-rhamnosidase
MSARVFIPASRLHLADANTLPRHPADQGAWVWHPAKAPQETAVLRFRLRFSLAAPAAPLIHVTADQRFQLRCDGRDLTFGPDRCDIEHWTVHSIRPELSAGEHELEALVWFITPPAVALGSTTEPTPPMAQMSWRGGFMLFAEEEQNVQLNTGSAPWLVEDLTPALKFARPELPGYHDVGPTFAFDLALWNQPAAGAVSPAIIRPPIAINPHGVRRPGWCLHPATLAEQERVAWRGGRIRALRAQREETPWTEADSQSSALAAWQSLLEQGAAVTVQPRTTLTLLWDFQTYVCGYPEIRVSGGEGTRLAWSWAESLYNETSPAAVTGNSLKGHRDEIIGKVFVGIEDSWKIGPASAHTTPALWWRCGRYARLTIETADAPLVVSALGLTTTGYPLDRTGSWSSSDAGWDRLLPLFERAQRRAAHEVWVDTPYYEQLGYIGDNVLMALHNYAWFGDARLSRRAIEVFGWSRRESGMIAERYPSNWRQESATFAMLWPTMLRDYAWWRDDAPFIKSQLPVLRSLLSEFDALAGDDGLLHQIPGWPFIDWVPEWDNGCGPGVRTGDSSIVNLHWVRALQAAAQIETAHGDPLLAQRCTTQAAAVFARVLARYWDDQRALLLDTVGNSAASEHAQTFALLTALLPADKTQACLAALRSEPSLARATIYFSFYVIDALYVHGDAAEMNRRLAPWRALPELGFTSTPEMPEPTRSDAHAWGAHPAWHTLASIAGVRPTAAGFHRVRVAPCLDKLDRLTCAVAHPRGLVELDLHVEAGDAVGTVTLPADTAGEFVWRGQTTPLQPGRNHLSPTHHSTTR